MLFCKEQHVKVSKLQNCSVHRFLVITIDVGDVSLMYSWHVLTLHTLKASKL